MDLWEMASCNLEIHALSSIEYRGISEELKTGYRSGRCCFPTGRDCFASVYLLDLILTLEGSRFIFLLIFQMLYSTTIACIQRDFFRPARPYSRNLVLNMEAKSIFLSPTFFGTHPILTVSGQVLWLVLAMSRSTIMVSILERGSPSASCSCISCSREVDVRKPTYVC